MEKIYTKLLTYSQNLIRTACIAAVLVLSNAPSYGEGTAELTPTLASDNQGVLQLWDNNDPARNSFTFGCPDTKKLYFTICNPEEVYFGMNFDTGDLTGTSTLWYRIIAPDFTIAFPTSGTGWQQVTNAGAGSIASWAQAKAGPNNIVGGAGGYTPLSFTPTIAGDFYIEFYRKSNAGMPATNLVINPNTVLTPAQITAQNAIINAQQKTKTRLRFFDLTVADAPNGNRILGRLFSQTWDINVNAANSPFIATMYVYSDDQIVTGLNFNKIRPFGFTIACNSTGVTNTGDAAVDRRSVSVNATYARYKIFLHDPDNSSGCYPTGIFGKVTGPVTISGCDVNNRCINIPVDKAGGTELLLNFNGIPGYQFGTTDVLLKQTLVVGSNCIHWDSKDGLGNIVTSASADSIDMRLDYFNGLTHLPLFDVENHPYGFIVSLVRPAGPPPLLFWDDTGIPGGSNGLAGCTANPGATPNPLGCHGFGSVTAGAMPITSNPTTGDWGNNRTINTWWYANYIQIKAKNKLVGDITVDANTNVVGTGASNNISSCTNSGAISLAGGVTGATGGLWSVKPGVTGTFSNPTSLTTIFTPSAADLAKTSIYIYLTSTGNGACPAIVDSMQVTFVAGPTVSAGSPQSACANNSTLTLNGNFTVATGIQWSGGGGTYVPNSTTKNATYTPNAAELTAGSVTLTITTTGNGICPAASAQVTHTYFKAPTVSAGSPVTVCANNSAAALVGTAANQTGVAWSGGGGIFTTPGSTSTTYNPSGLEKTGGPKTVTLTLTASKAGCNSVTSNVDVRINPTPIVYAGVDTTICKNDSFNLLGVVTHATGGTWTGGTGKFTPNANSVTANYKPSAAELAGTSVTLTLTSTGNGSCLAVADQMILKFIAAPTIDITGPASVCENNPAINLSAVFTGAPGLSWAGSGGSFVPTTTTSPVTYTPSAAELSLGFAGIVAKTTGGKCSSVTDTLIVTFGPAPTVDAGAPISICENNPTGGLTGSVTGVSTVTWTSPTGGFFSAPTNPSTNYTATAADITNGSVLLTVTANKATCNPVTDQVLVTITPKPTVTAGPTRTVCNNNATATFNGAFTGATGVLWTTGGDGTFGSPTSATSTYTAGPNDLIAGTVTLTLTTTGNGKCLPVHSTTTMTITPKPTVTPGTYSVCSNNAAVQLNGAVTIATGGTWIGGAGTFSPSRNVLNPIYTPTAAEITAGTLNLTLQSTTGNGNCNAVTGNATITFTPSPTLTPTTPVAVCADVPTATITTAKTLATGVLWSGGTGTIASPTSLSTTYTPSVSEITAGTATLTVTTTGTGTCSPVSATLTVTIAPAPTVSAGANQVVCGTVATVSNLAGTVTGATGGTWTKVSGTGTFGNANNTSTTYTPSNQDVINGSVTLRLTSTGNGLCQPVSNTMTINYTPVPSINAGVDQIVCSTELPIKLSASGSPAVWSPSGGSFANANSLTTTYTPSAGEISPGTVTLTISTIPSGACPVKTSQLTVTIPAGPIVNVGAPTQTMCGSLTAFQLNGIITNATGGVWTTTGTGSFLPNANALNATYQPSATDRTNGSVALTLTSTGNGLCKQVSKTLTLTITPAITVSAGPNQTLCADVSGIPLNGTMANATGVLWSITTGSGSITSPTSLTTTYIPSSGDLTTGTVSLLLTTTGNNGCPAVTSPVTFTLTPAPTLNQGSPQTICGDSAFVQLNASITVANGVVWTSNGTGTFSPNNATLNAKYIPSAADIAAGSVILTATTTGNGTCNPVVKTLTITITPVVTLNPGSNQIVCENNSAVNLNALITTATAVNWTTNGTGTFTSQTLPSTTYNPSAGDISAGLVTLTVKTTGNGTCKSKTAQVQVTIKPAPIVDAGLPQTVCSNVSVVSLTGSVLNASGGHWTTNGTGTFSDDNALVTTYAPSKADTTAGSVILTLTSTGNGTCNPVFKTVTITFKKLPIVVAGPNQTICGDSAYVQLAGKITNAGGGVWTKSGTGSFFPSTIDLNAVYSPTAADKTTGIVTLTLTSTSNGVCPSVSSNLTVIITAAPKVTVSGDQTKCANDAVADVSGDFSVSSGIKWTTSGTGTFSLNNTSKNVRYTPSALDKSAGLVVLALSTTGNGTCKPAQGFITLTITPAPTLTAGFDKSICADSAGVLLNQAAVTIASGVQWSTNGSGVFGPNNTTVQPTYFPSTADVASGLVKLVAVTTGNGKCLPVRDTINVSITPAPTVTAGTDISVCADTSSVKLAGNSTVAGGIIWTSSGTGVFTPSATIKNAEYIPSIADTISKNVTLTLTTTNNGTCKPVSSQINLTIAPQPVVEAGSPRTVCADVDQLLMGGIVNNATGGLWSTNGTGTFSPSSGTLNPNYTPSASDLTVGTVVLTLVSTGNGLCRPVSDNVTIKFNPVATISAGNDLQVCNSVSSVALNGSSTNTSNVTWSIISGAGSLSSVNTLSPVYTISTPADITAGSVTLRITGTALSGCSNVMNDVTITFVASPPIEAGPSKTVCDTDLPIQLVGTGSTAQWSGGTGTFSPNNQTLNALYTPSAGEISGGTVTLTLTTTNNGVCTAATDNVTYTIIPGPKVDAGTTTPSCSNISSVNLTGTTNGVSSTGVQWSTAGSGTFTNGNTLTPTYLPSTSDKNGGQVVLTITSTGNNVACKPAKDTVYLNISPAPTIAVGSNQTVCGDAATVDISSTFTNATGVIWTNGTSTGTFGNATFAKTKYNVALPADTTAGTITVNVQTTGQNVGCLPASAQMTINFTKLPQINPGPPITVCTDTTSVPLNGKIGIATGGIWSSTTGGTFTPNASLLNASYIPSVADIAAGNAVVTLTSTGNGNCKAYSKNVTITLNPKPTIGGSVPQDSICTGNVINGAIATFTNAGSILWKTTGTGTFSTTTGSPTVYTPSKADEDNGGVIIYATTVGSNPCKEIEKYFSITILKSPASLVNAGFDQIACADAGIFPLNGTIGGLSGSGIWSSNTGRGDFYPDATDLNPIFVPDQTDINAGGLTIRLSSTNNGICSPSFDDMILTITPAPTVTAGAPLPILCSDTAFIQLNPTITNALGGEWTTTGTGTFSPSITDLNAVYVPSAADRKKGVIGLTLTTTGNGTCNSYSDFLNIRLSPKPTLYIGTDKTICADQSVDLNAEIITVATGVDWTTSGVGGLFTAPSNSTATQYIFSDADTTNKVLNIFAKTVNQGLCKPVFDTLKVTIKPIPVVIASAGQTICADANSVSVSSIIANAAGVDWTTNGSGSFTPNSSGNPVTYTISEEDRNNGTVQLLVTSTNSGICGPQSDFVDIAITPTPIVSAGAPIICDTLAGATLTGSVISGLTGTTTWTSSSGSGTFAVNNSVLGATYVPSHADIVAGKVTLILTASNFGTCLPVPSTAVLLIEPLPIADAGQDQISCMNASVTVSANNRQPGVNYSWKDGATVVAPANSPSHTFTVVGNAQRVLLAENYKGCITTDTVNISTFTLPSFTLTPNPACYQENLLVQSNPSPSPTVPGLYQWYNNGKIMTGEDKTFVVVPDTGTYKIEYSYNNCSSNNQIDVRPIPTITVADIIACGSGTLTASAVPANATINWSLNGSGIGTGSPITITSVPNDTIKYDLRATNPATGCFNTDSVYVIGLPVPEMIELDSTSCVGLTVRLTARPNNIPYLDQFLDLKFDWRKDGGSIFAIDSTITVNSLGVYKGAVTIGQCKDTSTNVIAFSAYPTSTLPDDYMYCPETDTTVLLDPGTEASTTYVWNNGFIGNKNKVSPAADSVYVVTITNQFFCSITDKTTVYAICAPVIEVPTAFTPDISGSGDQIFRGFGKYETNYKLMVFNRWGEVIFISNDKLMGWDGNYLGQQAPSGVYPWIVTYEGRAQFKGPYKKTGSVTLIR